MGIHKTHKLVIAFIKDYWQGHGISPTIREIASGLKIGKSSVQNSLRWLEDNGDIKRLKRQSRNIRLLNLEMPAPPVSEFPGLLIRGEIAAGYCHDPFTEESFAEEKNEYLSIEYAGRKPDDYVLRVSGDSMVGAAIPDGAYVGMRRVPAGYKPKAGQIVAVWVQGLGTTLKHFYKRESVVVLEAANPKYDPIIVDLREQDIKVQGAHIFTHWQAAVLV